MIYKQDIIIKYYNMLPPSILITGATGYIGSWCVKTLLEHQHSVRVIIRDLSQHDRYLYLKQYETINATIEFVQCDLLDPPEKWDGVMKDIKSILHLASPTKWNSLDPEHELLIPALQGTKNVLEAAQRSGTVTKIVITSSISAVSHDFAGFETKLFTENDWNTTASLKEQGYAFSKIQAEKFALDFVQKNPNLSLVVLLPAAVYGPLLSKSTMNDVLYDSFVKVLNGELPVEMNISGFLVDVRDVALAHVHAIERPEVNGRYILWSDTVLHPDFFAQMKIAAPKYESRLPRHLPIFPPKWFIVPLVQLTQPKPVGDILKAYYGKHPRFDTSKAIKELGITFRSAGETIQDTTKWIVENGMCKPI
jgi:dihydroflavonol-4-reductase